MESFIKQLLQKAMVMVDGGECDDITDEELEQISIIIHRPETMGREDAAKYLGVSLNRFHELRDKGVIPFPKKIRGHKEKMYYTSDLKKIRDSKGFGIR